VRGSAKGGSSSLISEAEPWTSRTPRLPVFRVREVRIRQHPRLLRSPSDPDSSRLSVATTHDQPSYLSMPGSDTHGRRSASAEGEDSRGSGPHGKISPHGRPQAVTALQTDPPSFYAFPAYQNAPPPAHLHTIATGSLFNDFAPPQTTPDQGFLSGPGVIPRDVHGIPLLHYDYTAASYDHIVYPLGAGPHATTHVHPQVHDPQVHRFHAPPLPSPGLDPSLQDTSMSDPYSSSSSLESSFNSSYGVGAKGSPKLQFPPMIPYPWIMEGVPGIVRSRTTHACENCRKRKTKVRTCRYSHKYFALTDQSIQCSGDRPICTRCEKGGFECVYEPRYRHVAKTSQFVPENQPTASVYAPQPGLPMPHSSAGSSSESVPSDGSYGSYSQGVLPHTHARPHILPGMAYPPPGYPTHSEELSFATHSFIPRTYPLPDFALLRRGGDGDPSHTFYHPLVPPSGRVDLQQHIAHGHRYEEMGEQGSVDTRSPQQPPSRRMPLDTEHGPRHERPLSRHSPNRTLPGINGRPHPTPPPSAVQTASHILPNDRRSRHPSQGGTHSVSPSADNSARGRGRKRRASSNIPLSTSPGRRERSPRQSPPWKILRHSSHHRSDHGAKHESSTKHLGRSRAKVQTSLVDGFPPEAFIQKKGDPQVVPVPFTSLSSSAIYGRRTSGQRTLGRSPRRWSNVVTPRSTSDPLPSRPSQSAGTILPARHASLGAVSEAHASYGLPPGEIREANALHLELGPMGYKGPYHNAREEHIS
jgi:hypothetical protein